MLDQFISVGPIHTQTYTFLLGVAIVMSGTYAAVAYWLQHDGRISGIVDVCIAGLIGGVIAARAVHVVLNRVYFQDNRDEITRLAAGGLDWHGAVIGGLLAMWIVARWRGVKLNPLLDSLALVLPLIGFFAWWGCIAAYCGFGAEVDNLSNYPAWLVWERKDIFGTLVPRYATQPLGMAFSLILLAIMRGVHWQKWFENSRFWLSLTVFAAGMFILGETRGDFAETLGGLREDQWLDLFMIALGVIGVGVSRRNHI
jgi:phosphatidylglycerol:prolipoprotein diacylglycerol transferase